MGNFSEQEQPHPLVEDFQGNPGFFFLLSVIYFFFFLIFGHRYENDHSKQVGHRLTAYAV